MSTFDAIVIGDQSLTRECARQLLERGHCIAAFVSADDGLRDWAAEQGVPVMRSPEALGELRCDWLFSIANLRVLDEEVLQCASRGAVNFHDGPLPEYAGLNAPVWALLAGEARHGVTWHMMDAGIDKGDVVVQRNFDIAYGETALSLNARCYAAGIESFADVLKQVEQGAPARRPQDVAQRRYFGRDKRPEAAGVLRFDRPAETVARMVRALDHGEYRNPLCLATIRSEHGRIAVGSVAVSGSEGAPGEILAVDGANLSVACGYGAVILSDLRYMNGEPANPREIVTVGDRLPILDETEAVALQREAEARAPAERHWRSRLKTFAPVTLPSAALTESGVASLPLDWPATLDHVARANVVTRWAAQAAGLETGDVALAHSDRWLPFRRGEDLCAVLDMPGIAEDLFLREPGLATLVTPDIAIGEVASAKIRVNLDGDLHYDTAKVPAAMAQILADRLMHHAWAEARGEVTESMPEAERELVLHGWNRTHLEYDRTATMQTAFEAQVAETPAATALVVGPDSLTYRDLNARANRLAHRLRAKGVGPGTLVGLCASRNANLVIGALAIHKTGGAYVPMDPDYPADLLAYYLEDSGAGIVLSETALRDRLPETEAEVLWLDADVDDAPDHNPDPGARPEDLAYLIYTSGSTGRPKGVMVEHRNVINFFAGMDARIGRDTPGTWAALTSLSFDISVLELFYSLARGYKLVLVSEEQKLQTAAAPTTGGMQFSLYYWGNDDGVGRDKYHTLLEGAKFADLNGFCAIWTPERHFHAFGGPYPNPSVTGAAVAAVTRNLAVRAGSCVAPLHHTARIAEEWAVIDNLTNGRSGLAIASGWQPDDFVLRPENTPPENKSAMLSQIAELRRLWAGEAVEYPRADGSSHAVVTQPRPVSKTLPVWVTTAGNPETWEEAGRIGANVLTHLLGQTVDEVAQKIEIYHAALREAGHDPANFTVTLMLHTFVAASRDEALEVAREPMKSYLRSAAGLIKQYAWAFPAFKRPMGAKNAFDLSLEGLSEVELDAILDFAFQRYFDDSGMFGTVEDCVAKVEQLKAIGVGEVACLIDYGIPATTVLTGLRPLAEVVARCNERTETDFSIAAQIARHDVTHLQCTPSMARLLLMSSDTRAALGRVKTVMLGGEPLPGALVGELRSLTDARIENMYGPTETTIWSSTGAAESGPAICNLGTPIANTQMYVLDEDGEPVPVGVTGELFIGGESVTRGYWQRPGLTAERFVENPFADGRMYRTGDLACWRADGRIDFVGRNDSQVKLRGYRVETGGIEAQMESLEGVQQAVAVAQGDALIAFYIGTAKGADLRAALAAHLPAFMVPSRIEQIAQFPLTPNRKVDRKALAERKSVRPAAEVKETGVHGNHPTAAPVAGPMHHDDLMSRISNIWSRVLGVADIPASGNFFDLGGHSLLAVQVHREMRDDLGLMDFSIADVFGYPTLSGLTARIAETAKPAPTRPVVEIETQKAAVIPVPTKSVSDNATAAARQEAIARRREMRARRRVG